MSERSGEGIHAQEWRNRLSEDGYLVIQQALGTTALDGLRDRFSDTALSDEPRDNFGEAGAFFVADYRDPALVELLAHPTALDVLAQLGYPHPKLHSFYFSTKPPGSQGLTWHSDLFYKWDRPEPNELFMIHYLQDTSRENGCLRVVPGSHRWPRGKWDNRKYGSRERPGEVDVPIQAGDLLIADRRILHATHANRSNDWRTGLTVTYAPDFDNLPEPVQALIVRNQCLPPRGWQHTPETETLDRRLQPILPVYDGEAEPIAIEL